MEIEENYQNYTFDLLGRERNWNSQSPVFLFLFFFKKGVKRRTVE